MSLGWLLGLPEPQFPYTSEKNYSHLAAYCMFGLCTVVSRCSEMFNSFPMKNILCKDKLERNAKWLEDQFVDQDYQNFRA